jgi:hypothetical protein
MAATPAQNGNNEAGNTDSSRKTVALCGWPTPRSEDSEQTGAHRGSPDTLNSAAKITGWATPAARDFKSEEATEEFNEKRWGHARGKPLSAEETLASGPPSTSSPAQTANRGALNPALSRWLQGYPVEWCTAAILAYRSIPKRRRKPASCVCEDTAMQSCPKQRQNSSELCKKV